MAELLPPPVAARVAGCPPNGAELVTIAAQDVLVRLVRTSGAHPLSWNQFREDGPLTTRFDHRPVGGKVVPRRGVLYACRGATAFTATIAEAFQDQSGTGVGPVDLDRNGPVLVEFAPTRDVTVLDLDSGWITRAGGNQAITTGPRSICRLWAQMIYDSFPHLEGLTWQSSVWGPGRAVAWWERSESALPTAPLAYRALGDPTLMGAVANAVVDLGTTVVGGWATAGGGIGPI